MHRHAAQDRVDYVVIGGGTAGCVVAGRLSEDPGVQVLLLERGHDTTDDARLIPPSYNSVLATPAPNEFLPIETLFTREPKLAEGLTKTYVAKALGGGPAISGSFWGRGDPSNYDEWSQLGNPGWSYDELLPYFKKSESYRELFRPALAVSADRGVDGPIQVGILNDEDPVLATLLATASRAFQVRVQHDYNTSAGLEGFAPMQRNLGHAIDRPRRSTPYTGYIRPYLATRPNLHVVDMATVTRIHFDHSGQRAEGVEYLRKGETHRASAAREILLCAGAINSPKILMQSGVGTAQELDALGVTPVVEVPGVGRNLHDHIFLPFVYRTDPQVLPLPAAESPVLIGFFKSPRSRWIDLELACCVMPGGLLVGFLISLRNEAFGCVRLTSPDPLAPPYIEYRFDPRSPDMDTMMEACRMVRRWLFDSKLVTAEIEPGVTRVPMDADATQWQAWFATKMRGIYHMAGTCKMGPPQDPLSVVDHQLRLRGVPNLRIADCSIMPRVVASHPAASAAMIGEKLADMVKRQAPQ